MKNSATPLRLLAGIAFSTLASLSLLACASVPPMDSSAADVGDREIAVIKYNWHTEIAMPLQALSGPLARIYPNAARTGYLIVGFGDRAYFTDREAGVGTAIAALFPGPAVIELNALDDLPSGESFSLVRLHLTQDALDRIEHFVWESLAKREDGSLIEVVEHEPTNRFYEARQNYDVLDNCNNWTTEALRTGGLPFSTDMLFADEVIDQAKNLSSIQEKVVKAKYVVHQ